MHIYSLKSDISQKNLLKIKFSKIQKQKIYKLPYL